MFFVTSQTVVAQNTGIGTTNPAEKLHVAGNIKADTVKPNAFKLTPNAGDGKILTSDALGNASWQKNSATAGNIGYGVWGDCATNGNISDYNPVIDETGAAGDFFGYSVSISGNFAVVGAFEDDFGVNTGQGSASFFQFNGTNWVLMQKVTNTGGAFADHFGHSVSISGNYAIVGAPDDDGVNADQGSASIYQFNGTSWVLMQKITDATGAAGDNYGHSVSISGNYAIVGAYTDDVGVNTDQGTALIYQYNGTSWVLMNKIADAAGAADDNLGLSVSISGNYAIVGAPLDDVGANFNQGSALIYQFNGSSWVLMNKVTDAAGESNDQFGHSVSISGNYAISGAYLENVGTTIFQGSASIYQYNGTNWVLMQKITDVNGATGYQFGFSVAISGNYAIVGAYGEDVGANTDQGSSTIYQRLGLGWQKLQYLADPGGNAADHSGVSVSIDGSNKRFVTGANGYAGNSGKAVFGKIN